MLEESMKERLAKVTTFEEGFLDPSSQTGLNQISKGLSARKREAQVSTSALVTKAKSAQFRK